MLSANCLYLKRGGDTFISNSLLFPMQTCFFFFSVSLTAFKGVKQKKKNLFSVQLDALSGNCDTRRSLNMLGKRYGANSNIAFYFNVKWNCIQMKNKINIENPVVFFLFLVLHLTPWHFKISFWRFPQL